MDSDGELMFHQMMEEETNFALDDEENKQVMAVTDEKEDESKHGGSRVGKKANKNRHRATGHMLSFSDYFPHKPANDDHDFRRRLGCRGERVHEHCACCLIL